MPSKPNTLARILVPLIVLLLGVGIAIAVLNNTNKGLGQSAAGPVTSTNATPANPPASTSSVGSPAAQSQPAAAPSTPPSAPPSSPPATANAQPPTLQAPPPGQATSPAPTGKLAAKTYPFDLDKGYELLGSKDPSVKGGGGGGGKYEIEFEFSHFGSGLKRLTLANHFTTIRKTDHDVIQNFEPMAGASDRVGIAGFAMNKLTVDGQDIELGLTSNPGETFWKQIAPGSFEATIADDAGRNVLRVTRRYVLPTGSFNFTLEQRVENLSDKPVSVVWHQFGPTDLPIGIVRYGGDVRRIRFGYQLPLKLDPDQYVLADDSAASLITHQAALDKPAGTFVASGQPRWDSKVLWPNEQSKSKELSLAWAGVTSRYFTVAMYGPQPIDLAPGGTPGKGPDKKFSLVSEIDRFAIPPAVNPNPQASGVQGVMILRVTSVPITIAPGQAADVSMGAYAGPTSERVMEAPANVGAFWHGVQRIVIYTFGGPCGFCTFQPVAALLKGFLTTLHDWVFHDWALSIMFLVVCVRSILHPVTRWSQTKMMRFTKQLGKMAPKQKALQEKYKNDPAKLREEQAKLMREEKIDYFGAVGCLPPLLQTPIWIALYAMIFFLFDLRHSPAFFGVIQGATAGKWIFLGDLAEPDNFVNFHDAFGSSIDGIRIPFLSGLMGPIQGINILPMVLGVVFYIQQKYLTPPPTAALTPEQEQQQKIMKVMTVVMFPLFMYNAPAGLSLYFMTNSTLGILESKWIRSHAEKKIEEENARRAQASAGYKVGRSEPERKGFIQRLQDLALERQKLMEESRKAAQKKSRK